MGAADMDSGSIIKFARAIAYSTYQYLPSKLAIATHPIGIAGRGDSKMWEI